MQDYVPSVLLKKIKGDVYN